MRQKISLYPVLVILECTEGTSTYLLAYKIEMSE